MQNSGHGISTIHFSNLKNNFFRAKLTLQAEPLITAKAKERQIRKPDSVVANLPPQEEAGKTRDELSTLSGVSARNISKVKNILASGNDDLIAAKAKERMVAGTNHHSPTAILPEAST